MVLVSRWKIKRKRDKMKKNIKYLFLILLVILIFQGCKQEDKSIKKTGFVIGTIVSIQLNGTDDETIMEGCFDILSEIDRWMSLNIDSSLINKLNSHAGQGPMKVSQEAFYVIQKALDYGELSGGLFDISMEPVISLWGIGSDEAAVPNDEDLTRALALVDYKKISLDEKALTVEALLTNFFIFS